MLHPICARLGILQGIVQLPGHRRSSFACPRTTQRARISCSTAWDASRARWAASSARGLRPQRYRMSSMSLARHRSRRRRKNASQSLRRRGNPHRSTHKRDSSARASKQASSSTESARCPRRSNLGGTGLRAVTVTHLLAKAGVLIAGLTPPSWTNLECVVRRQPHACLRGQYRRVCRYARQCWYSSVWWAKSIGNPR
jgi:hypothetical protein